MAASILWVDCTQKRIYSVDRWEGQSKHQHERPFVRCRNHQQGSPNTTLSTHIKSPLTAMKCFSHQIYFALKRIHEIFLGKQFVVISKVTLQASNWILGCNSLRHFWRESAKTGALHTCTTKSAPCWIALHGVADAHEFCLEEMQIGRWQWRRDVICLLGDVG